MKNDGMLTLEKVAECCSTVFVDTNIVSTAYDRGSNMNDFCSYLGRGTNLSEIKYSVFERQRDHLVRMSTILHDNSHIRATSGISYELSVAQNHYNNCFQYYSSGKNRWGDKLKLLRAILTTHRNICDLFIARDIKCDEVVVLQEYIVLKALHISRNTSFRKSRVEAKTDSNDAELAAYAICEALNWNESGEPVGVVSCDADIFNILTNFEEDYHTRMLPSMLQHLFYRWTMQIPVHAYRPPLVGWKENLELQKEVEVRPLDLGVVEDGK